MGCGDGLSPSPQPLKLSSDIFREQAPYYLSIGVPYDLYWHSNDPEILREYVEADKLRQKRKDIEAWMQGAYIKKAIESSIGNAFLEKGAQPIEYPEHPLSYEPPEKTEKEKQDEAERERLRLVAYLDGVRVSRAAMERSGKDG